jgi:hypothetical protein
MKKFIQKCFFWFSMFLIYKLVIGTLMLSGTKEPLHSDLGVSGKKQDIIVGSSNVYINYDYQRMNEMNCRPIRSCWMPASYGAALNLYKLNLVAKNGDRLVVEYPYHWYLFDLMAPHNASFYSKANLPFYTFFAQYFPTDFIGHTAMFSIFQPELWTYLLQTNSNPNQNPSSSSLSFKIDVDSSYYTCNQLNYKRIKHNIQANTYQDFQFKKIVRHFQSLKKAKNLEVYFNYPAMEKGNYSVNEELIQAVGKYFPTLTTFQESIWEHPFQFDQRYHLNACGAELNSRRLAKRLEFSTSSR